VPDTVHYAGDAVTHAGALWQATKDRLAAGISAIWPSTSASQACGSTSLSLAVMMPEMDGFEFLDALAAREEWREIPVIVITAKQLMAGERERLLRQARKVLEKATATRFDIAAAIGEAIRRRHVAPPQIE